MANVMRLAMGIVRFPPISLMDEVLNRRQCENLLFNFQNGVQALQSITNGHNFVFHKAEEDLYQIVHRARVLIEECCREDWCRGVVIQMTNKECFRELLVDFENCFNTMCDISCLNTVGQETKILAIRNGTTFYPTSIDAIKEDQISIFGRFSKHLDSCTTMDCNDCKLVQYLKEYLMSLQHVEGGELDKIDFPKSYPRPQYGQPPRALGCSGYGIYVLANWLGLECATKVSNICYPEELNQLRKEASIWGGLNHPNIIKLYCCGFDEVEKQFEIVMELGMKSLSRHLGESPLGERNAVDIMLQIANGMCYLHDMKVAHRDLKPSNILVNLPKDSTLIELGCIHVKLLDFGISKVEVKDCPEVPTDKHKMGSCGYMAPEVMANQLWEVDALKADVFSFGMICSDILEGDKPCFGSLRDYRVYIQKSKRPKLPETYSKGLRSLVHDCWSLDPLKRPTFLRIHEDLARLKSTMLKGLEVYNPEKIKGVTNHAFSLFSQVFSSCKSFVTRIEWLWLVPQFEQLNIATWFSSAQENSPSSTSYPICMEVNNNNMGEFSKLIGAQDKVFQLERQLQSVGSLGIVGMCGIGKSTLARALSNHISHHFDATCFVFDLKDEICTFSLMHKSKDMQDLLPRAQTLRESRNILETILKRMKILLIVDNVSHPTQLCYLLDHYMSNDVDSRFKLIATSRDWKSLDQHVPMAGKVDMQTLSGNQPMELFSMHAFGTNQSCLPHLKHVVEKIVDACCGLPLSLEVMGTCMQGEKRLRIWERTLHRLLRARDNEISDEKIWELLRISFDELNDQQKNMFLDIACFFCKGACHDGVYATQETFLRTLDGDINIAKKILASLENKSLLKLDDGGCLDIHDQLRDMGCMITEKDFARSRILDLRYPTFANHCKQKGIEFVQGLSFTKLEYISMSNVDMEVKYMGKLRVLNVRFCENIDLLSAIVQQSPNLRWLKIHFSIQNVDSIMEPIHSIEKFFINTQYFLHNLRVLELFNCNFLGSIPCEYLEMTSLKEITFSNCKNMESFINGASKLITLEEMRFFGCKNMAKIPQEMRSLTCLRKLGMKECEDLQSFIVGLSNLLALEELNLSKCQFLRMIPKGFGSLTSLKKLDMCECEALEEFPLGLSNLLVLEELNISKCRSLKKIPEGFGGLKSLKKLDMCECEALEEFPLGLSNLLVLEELNISKCRSLKMIPEGFGSLTSLKKLDMCEGEALEEFPLGLSSLLVLEELNISKCRSLKMIPEGFGSLRRLKKLDMWECEALEELPHGLRNLLGFEELNFSKCWSLKMIPDGFGSLTSLKKLDMCECEALEEFPLGLSNLLVLEQLNISKCRSLKKIPEGFGGLKSLKKLDMCECEALEEFPLGLSGLLVLEELNISKCRSLKMIPEGFGSLMSLKKLDMWECEALEELPHGLSNLLSFEELNFSKCRSLKMIPEGFGSLTSLKKLDMCECEALEEFPLGLSSLLVLEELNISKYRSLKKIPEGFVGLKNLKKLDMCECESLDKFPLGLSNLLVLEELNISKCWSLKKIPEGFVGLKNLKKLDMCECEALEEFPLGLSNLLVLEELNFSKCRAWRKIPEGFGSLMSLKKLDMWECESLDKFPLGLSKLSFLRELDLSKCRSLKKIPEGFGSLKSLKKLYLQGCEALEEFPLGLSNLFGLEELDISKCQSLKKIPEGFGGLKSLKKLYLQGCEALEDFPFGISNILALEELNFSKCRALRRIPEGFGSLTSLKKLDMRECESLDKFPLGLSKLSFSRELDLSKCRSLKKIPEGFGSLKSLKKLYLQGCEALEEFPLGLNNLSSLEEFDISKCRSLKVVPEGFGSLSNLKKLDMRECEALEEFPLGISNLLALEELDLSKCRSMKKIPEGFGSLKSLKKLYLQGCEALEEFPLGLNNLSSLEEFDISKCRSLKVIPEGFGSLSNLKKLDMRECEALEEFPLGISNLLALEELDLSKCRSMKKIPEGFGTLKSLKKLDMLECKALEEFPNGLSNILGLEEFNFSKCSSRKKY